MHDYKKNVLLISMPFAGTNIPSIQLAILLNYLGERDIDIKTNHLYLKAAEIYGIINYNSLIYPPNDSYSAQMIFSKYIFPEYWENNEYNFKKYYNKNMLEKVGSEINFSFEDYVKKSDLLYKWTVENVEWKKYDIIGFTLNYGQFLPSLAIAKKIKEESPHKIIILGGSRTVGTLGKKVLETFDFVDFIVSGDGEESLYQLASDVLNYKSIPGLIYRDKNKIVWNDSNNNIILDDNSIPLYDDFFNELYSSNIELQQYFHYSGYLPIEISRGCWWNKCSFCNLNLQHQKYREKSIKKIVEEIQFLSNKYKILNFQFIGNTLPAKNYINLFTEIISLKKDFNIVVEARAGKLESNDYTLLKEAGFTNIQTGIESFSKSYLKKMNKGVRVIDNIAALKFCKENGIKNNYNLIINFPNEEPVDFLETKKNIEYIKNYLDPPHICNLRVVYGSPIQCNPEYYNIKNLAFASIDKLMFPSEILEKNVNFVYDFIKKENIELNNWNMLIDDWKKERERLSIVGIRNQTDIDKFVFYYVDGGKFLNIYDKRNSDNIKVYKLNIIERDIFLSCIDVSSFKEIKQKISNVSESELIDVLNAFHECGIIFKEDDFYFSLPLNYKKCIGKSFNNKLYLNKEKEDIIRLEY